MSIPEFIIWLIVADTMIFVLYLIGKGISEHIRAWAASLRKGVDEAYEWTNHTHRRFMEHVENQDIRNNANNERFDTLFKTRESHADQLNHLEGSAAVLSKRHDDLEARISGLATAIKQYDLPGYTKKVDEMYVLAPEHLSEVRERLRAVESVSNVDGHNAALAEAKELMQLASNTLRKSHAAVTECKGLRALVSSALEQMEDQKDTINEWVTNVSRDVAALDAKVLSMGPEAQGKVISGIVADIEGMTDRMNQMAYFVGLGDNPADEKEGD